MTRPTARRIGTVVALVVIVSQALLPTPMALSCPFCLAVTNTFSEDIANMDAVIIASLSKPLVKIVNESDPTTVSPPVSSSIATFGIEKVLKGKKMLGDSKTISSSVLRKCQAR